jgi:hypothetical protein
MLLTFMIASYLYRLTTAALGKLMSPGALGIAACSGRCWRWVKGLDHTLKVARIRQPVALFCNENTPGLGERLLLGS